MSRVIWKGHISFGLVQIPVGLYPASQDDDLDFTLLDKRDMNPIGYRRINKSTGEEVPSDVIVRGFAWDEGEYVIVTDEELKSANPEATQTIDIVAFVDAEQLDPRYFVRPYYVAPTKRSAKAYALLRETMRGANKIGIAKVVLRTRQYVSALMVRGDILVLELLRYATEVRGTQEFDLPGRDVAAAGVTERELKMADMLVQTLATDWDPTAYEDEYRKDVLAMIEQKARTGVTAPRRAVEEGAEAGEVIDIAALLKRSVEAHRAATGAPAAEAEPEPEPEAPRPKPRSRKKVEA